MSDTLNEQLLGYLLRAIDDAEQEAIESRLRVDPKARQALAEMRRSLRPLERFDDDFEPPPGLAQRTCQLVAEEALRVAPERRDRAGTDAGPHFRPFFPRRAMGPVPPTARRAGRVTRGNWLVAAGVVLVASLIVVPAVHQTRFGHQLRACQSNLRELGTALGQYSQRHGGYFPMVPGDGRLAAAGIYAPTLLDDGYLTQKQAVVCPGSPLNQEITFRVPSVRELQNASEEELSILRCSMGGSYGYSLGYVDPSGNYCGPKNRSRSHYAIAADAPSDDRPDHQSANHGGLGQNVLFEDGQIRFLTKARFHPSADDLFTNDDGFVAAGLHVDDSVIGPSNATPLRFIRRAK